MDVCYNCRATVAINMTTEIGCPLCYKLTTISEPRIMQTEVDHCCVTSKVFQAWHVLRPKSMTTTPFIRD